jgi:hypothetical protein
MLGYGLASEVSKATGSLIFERRLEKTHTLFCRPSHSEIRATAIPRLLAIRSRSPIGCPVEKPRRWNRQGFGKPLDGNEPRLPSAALDARYLVGRNIGRFGQLGLRPASPCAQCLHLGSEGQGQRGRGRYGFGHETEKTVSTYRRKGACRSRPNWPIM